MPWLEAGCARWLSCYHFLLRQTSNRNKKTLATFLNGIYLCTNSTRFAYRKICLRVILLRHSRNNDNTPSMPLEEAHLEGFLFCTLWINKYTLKKCWMDSGLDVAMVAAEYKFLCYFCLHRFYSYIALYKTLCI
jgi:hypothetical protein